MGERIVITGRAACGETVWTNEIEYDKEEWEAMSKQQRYYAVVDDMLDFFDLTIWYEEPDYE